VLIEAAKAGKEKEVEEYAEVFTEHANKLVEVRIVANCAISAPGLRFIYFFSSCAGG